MDLIALSLSDQTAIGAAIDGAASYPSSEKSSNVNANRSDTDWSIFINSSAFGVRASCICTCCDMIIIDMRITERMHEIPWLQIAHLRH